MSLIKCQVIFTIWYDERGHTICCLCSRGEEDHDEEILCMAYDGALYVVAACRGLRIEYEYEFGDASDEGYAACWRTALRAGRLCAPGSDERGATHRRL